MRQDVWHRLDLLARSILPFFATLLLILVGMVPLRVPELSPVIPSLVMVAVYYWTVYKPNLMPLWAVFLIGLFYDLLGGGPVGVGILSLLLLHGLVGGVRRYMVGASFLAIWLVFAPIAAAAFFAGWALTCLIETRLIDPEPGLFGYLATIAVYPCLAWLFAQLQRSVYRRA
ncbi:MAG: rod shape-determining protein MreD [Kiloniellales bacterium]